jgi:hypothetical protein
MLEPMPKVRILARPLLTPLLLVVFSGMAWAQSDYRPAPKYDVAELAMRWISGRFIMPVTCTRNDGSVLTIEQAVAVRPVPERGGPAYSVRATFFGIDVADASHCYHLADSRLLDRRGRLYFNLPSRYRPDMGTTDFRHLLEEGQITFQISDGKLTSRPIGESDAEPEVVAYRSAGATVTVRVMEVGEDGFKALAALAPSDPRLNYRVRRLEFRVEHPEHGTFSSFFMDDWKTRDR